MVKYLLFTVLVLGLTPAISHAKTEKKPASTDENQRLPAAAELESLAPLSVNDFSFTKGTEDNNTVIRLTLKVNSSNCLNLEKDKIRFSYERTANTVKVIPYMLASGIQNCLSVPDVEVNTTVYLPISMDSTTRPLDYFILLPMNVLNFSGRSSSQLLHAIRFKMDDDKDKRGLVLVEKATVMKVTKTMKSY